MNTKDAIATPLRKVLGPRYETLRRTELQLESLVHNRPPEAMVDEAQEYWSSDDDVLPQSCHWRGAGIFDDDDERWLAMGRRHLRIYEQLVATADDPPPLHRIVEWGSGGGTNAVKFAPLAEEFVGVDLSVDTLAECGRQLAAIGFDGYVPMLVPVADPDRVLRELPGPVELFLCLYVYEVFPSQEYGLEVLRLAERMLVDGGLAFVQIKVATGGWKTRSRRFSYGRNLGSLTTYELDEFWSAAERAGFDPLAMKLLPKDPLNGNGPYAYILLQKPRLPGPEPHAI